MKDDCTIEEPLNIGSITLNGERKTDFMTSLTWDEILNVIRGNGPCVRKFHSVNGNAKLKRSKLFIDKKALAKICTSNHETIEEHLHNVETGQVTEKDVRIILDVYKKITKIVR